MDKSVTRPLSLCRYESVDLNLEKNSNSQSRLMHRNWFFPLSFIAAFMICVWDLHMFDYSLINNEVRVILLNLRFHRSLCSRIPSCIFCARIVRPWYFMASSWHFYSTSLLIRVVAAGCYSEFDHKHGENRICNGTNSRDFSKLDI